MTTHNCAYLTTACHRRILLCPKELQRAWARRAPAQCKNSLTAPQVAGDKYLLLGHIRQASAKPLVLEAEGER